MGADRFRLSVVLTLGPCDQERFADERRLSEAAAVFELAGAAR